MTTLFTKFDNTIDSNFLYFEMSLKQPLGLNLSAHSLVVKKLIRGAQADELGVKCGWRVIKINNADVKNMPEFQATLLTMKEEGAKGILLLFEIPEFNKIPYNKEPRTFRNSVFENEVSQELDADGEGLLMRRTGYLMKKGGEKVNPWKSRYFIAENRYLRYYKAHNTSEDKENCMGAIDLTLCEIARVVEDTNMFTLTFETHEKSGVSSASTTSSGKTLSTSSSNSKSNSKSFFFRSKSKKSPSKEAEEDSVGTAESLSKAGTVVLSFKAQSSQSVQLWVDVLTNLKLSYGNQYIENTEAESKSVKKTKKSKKPKKQSLTDSQESIDGCLDKEEVDIFTPEGKSRGARGGDSRRSRPRRSRKTTSNVLLDANGSEVASTTSDTSFQTLFDHLKDEEVESPRKETSVESDNEELALSRKIKSEELKAKYSPMMDKRIGTSLDRDKNKQCTSS